MVSRFFNEARATTLIKHPGIVEIFDCDVIDDRRATSSWSSWRARAWRAALAPGRQLRGRVRVGRIGGRADRQRAGRRPRARASSTATSSPRTSSSSSTAATGAFAVKILDFGIAKLAATSVGGVGSNTRTGSVLGTPVYMSPEQCRGVEHGRPPGRHLRARLHHVRDADGPSRVRERGARRSAGRAHLTRPRRGHRRSRRGPPRRSTTSSRECSPRIRRDRPLSMAAVVAELEQLLGTKASEFAHKIPVTSTMIGGVSLRPRVSLPARLRAWIRAHRCRRRPARSGSRPRWRAEPGCCPRIVRSRRRSGTPPRSCSPRRAASAPTGSRPGSW